MVGTHEFWKIRPYELQPKEKILKENELRSKVLKKFEIEKILKHKIFKNLNSIVFLFTIFISCSQDTWPKG